MQSQLKYVLITGASTGIGLITATALAKKGYYVFAGVRKDDDAQKIRTLSSNIHPLILDVSKNGHIEQAFHSITQICKINGLYALINNAGLNYVTPFELAEEEEIRNITEVNVIGLAKITQAFIPLLRQYASHHKCTSKIVNIASIAGTAGMAWQSFYHTTKFAVVGLSESLRLELNRQKIIVSAVLPGGIKTEFMPKSRKTYEEAAKLVRSDHPQYYKDGMKFFVETGEKLGAAPALVSKRVLKILGKERPKFKHVVGADAAFLYFLSKFVPSRLRHLLLRTLFKL